MSAGSIETADAERTPATADGARAGSGDLAAYASGSLGMGVWVTVPGLLLLYFLTNTLGVTPFVAGLALLVPKVIDAVVHPAFGSWSDRQARRHGHRRTMLRWGLLLAFAMIAMFAVPSGLTGVPAALWVATFYIVGNLLFAAFQVPYLTTPSDLKVGYHERTRVFMVRMVLLTIGLLAAGVLAPMIVGDHARANYVRMAVVLGVVMVVSGLVALRGVRRLTETCGFREPHHESHSPLADVRLAWSDRDFRMLVLSSSPGRRPTSSSPLCRSTPSTSSTTASSRRSSWAPSSPRHCLPRRPGSGCRGASASSVGCS